VVRLDVAHPAALAAALRDGQPPIVVRVTDDRVVVDPRTVAPDDDDVLAARLTRHAAGG
jgi:L-seryl-tRNA(Ser) seleniumtransferase